MHQLIEGFCQDGRAGGWTRGTQKIYSWYLTRWGAWCADHASAAIGDLTRSQVKTWCASLGDRWGPATRKGATTALRAFLNWCHTEGYTPTNLASAVRSPKIPKTVQRTVTVTELQALITACETPVARGLNETAALASSVRNAALVCLLFDSMIRVSEACNLRISDVDLTAGRLIVRGGKGGNDRLALFSGQTADLLRAWLGLRQSAEPELFISVAGNTPNAALTPRGMRIIIKNLGQRAGIANLSPHAFRRGGACALTLNGAPGRVVMGLAGWSSSRMLDIYTRGITDNDLKTAFDRYNVVDRAIKSEPQPAEK